MNNKTSNNVTLKTLALTTLISPALLLAPVKVHANGYHFLHQSAEGLGSAYSTNGTAANDISAMFSNPSSIARFDGTRFSIGGVLDMPTSKLKNPVATAPYSSGTVSVTGYPAEPEQPIDTAYGSALYFTHEYQPGLVLGISVGAPYAYVSDYPDTAVSRYTATKTALFAYNVSPTVAWQLNDQWSVGASINMQYYTVELGTMVATSVTSPSISTDVTSTITGKDLAFGFSLGTEYQMTEDTRFGLSYRSKISHSFDGDVELSGSDANYAALVSAASALGVTITGRTGSAQFDIATPSMLQIGVLHKLNDKFELYGNANRFGWSAFTDTTVTYGNGLADTVVDNNWHDSWFVAVGMGYQYSQDIKLRTGFAYDWNPTPADAVSPRAPNNDRWNVGLGMSYQYSEQVKLDFGYQFIKFTPVTIDLEGGNNIPRGTLSADLDLYAHIFMAQFNYAF
ncbi:outer membrane protein transport protein [Vibrio sp. SCSIO 43132]|uniref:OmpP1/FadL family transporter n=1 Tax=Vibrio sp. SCSIO 43132 TaxID=2779363 RepID=UPI001CAA301D|nr:outer membrane protein transport protein [Vibrio sp. SCSIO 43132]UAB71501.1 outer membrane protein transport protein [Vibrio sp. SCSIO 43132]